MQVLLVDDHPLFVDGLRDLLTRRGITVVGVARDGLEALQQARVLRPEIILMDIQMPNCDGLAATRLIKAELPAIKIVMLTMLEDDENLFEAIKSGACGYLLKTLDTNDFMQLLEGLARGESPLAPGLASKILQELAHSPRAAASGADTLLAELTSRQRQILELAAQEMTYKEIGATLGLAERTIKYHMGEIVQRLHLENRAQVVAYARLRLGKGT
ncbi:MAG TPA: response regulator transcription factor [Anaerolineae bacterium]|nr:response regulator transcription factor [Anaerolineae bacterium]HQI86303.1 response regulator transcription factor [Anaerolineae bacterium]